MAKFINRGYSLVVGDFRSGEGWRINDLQIRFDVSKFSNEKDNKNSAIIEVYNLSPEHVKSLQTPYLAVDFLVGYYGDDGEVRDLRRLFAGQAVNVTTRKSGPDLITHIEMGEGYLELNHEVLSKLVSPGKRVRDVFEEIRQEIPSISRGVYAGTNIDSRIVTGYPLMGEPRRLLDKLSSIYKVDYRIDDSVLYVNDSDGTVNNEEGDVRVVSPEGGLIETPYVVQSNKRKSVDDPESKNSTRWKMLLSPDISTGELVKLEYLEYTGWYKVDSLRHYGDFRGGDWYTEVNCIQNVKTS